MVSGYFGVLKVSLLFKGRYFDDLGFLVDFILVFGRFLKKFKSFLVVWRVCEMFIVGFLDKVLESC